MNDRDDRNLSRLIGNVIKCYGDQLIAVTLHVLNTV